MPEQYIVNAEDADKIADWLRCRGGIFVWKSINLSNPTGSWTTPAQNADGVVYDKPTWEAANKPERHITSMDDVAVVTPEAVKRFHVATRLGSQAMTLKVTDGGTNRIHKEVEKAREKYGRNAWYAFDYFDYDNAVIFVDSEPRQLRDWLIDHLYGVIATLQEQLANAEESHRNQASP